VCSSDLRIVPRIAFCPTTPGIGSSRYYFLKLGINSYRIPAQSKWNMQHVHSKISHDTYFTAILRLSFPVDGFQRVHITRVVKSGVYFDDLTQRAGFDLPDQSLWPGQERHLRTAPDKSTSLYRQLSDRGRCMEIDPKRLFGKKILARLDNPGVIFRSEERRVGKDGRYGGCGQLGEERHNSTTKANGM